MNKKEICLKTIDILEQMYEGTFVEAEFRRLIGYGSICFIIVELLNLPSIHSIRTILPELYEYEPNISIRRKYSGYWWTRTKRGTAARIRCMKKVLKKVQ